MTSRQPAGIHHPDSKHKHCYELYFVFLPRGNNYMSSLSNISLFYKETTSPIGNSQWLKSRKIRGHDFTQETKRHILIFEIWNKMNPKFIWLKTLPNRFLPLICSLLDHLPDPQIQIFLTRLEVVKLPCFARGNNEKRPVRPKLYREISYIKIHCLIIFSVVFMALKGK